MVQVPRSPLSRSDVRLVVIALLVAAISASYAYLNYSAAFPQASIRLKYSREEITRRAEEFLRKQGLDPAAFQNITTFEGDSKAQYFLERELDLTEANRLMAGPISVWTWRARWFHPPNKEELIVRLSPDGRLVGFEHVIAEDASGKKLSAENARQIAEMFLRAQAQAPHHLIAEQLEEHPGRFDYVFTWEQEGFRVKEATYRRTVTIQGDRVGGYAEFLNVPEPWLRGFQELRSKNILYASIAWGLFGVLMIAAVVAIFIAVRKRNVHWTPLLWIAAIVSIFAVVTQCNALPFFMNAMPTSMPLREAALLGFLQALRSGVTTFCFVIVGSLAGEPLYRRAFPERLSLLFCFTRSGMQSREFFRAVVVGYGFAAIHIAFLVAFYILGKRFGVWSPQSGAYYDLLSTAMPWIFPVTVGLIAATGEEFWFRLFAISLLRRWMPGWIAVLLPAFVWGFLHSTYPQQPGYIRGVEVGLLGVAAGFLMLRFGIVATLIWHFSVDAILIGLFLFQSEGLYFRMSAAVLAGFIMLPLLTSIFYYRRYGGFIAPETVSNASAEPPVEYAVVATTTKEDFRAEREPLAPAWRIGWLYSAAAVALILTLTIPAPKIGDFIRIRIGRAQAIDLAGKELKRRRDNPAKWRSVTTFEPNLRVPEAEYIRQILGMDAANRVLKEREATALWRTRYFRPLEKEAWVVAVDQQGQIYSADHQVAEDALGKNLSVDEARLIASAFLARDHGMKLSALRPAGARQEKRDRRSDYTFTWEDNSFEVGEARSRVAVEVSGDEVSGFRRFLKLPEDWVREFNRPRISYYLSLGTGVVILFAVLALFLRRLVNNQHGYHWRIYTAAGMVGLVVGGLQGVNRVPLFFSEYDSAIPIEDFFLRNLLRVTGSAIGVAVLAFAGTLITDVFRQQTEGNRKLPAVSTLRAAAVLVVFSGLTTIVDFLYWRLPVSHSWRPLWDIAGLDTWSPAIASLHQAFLLALAATCSMSVAAFVTIKYIGDGWRWPIVLGVTAVLAIGKTGSIYEYALTLSFAWVSLAILWFLWRTCGTDLWSFFLGVFWFGLANATASMWVQPALHASASILAITGVAAGSIAALLGRAHPKRMRNINRDMLAAP